jgi:hypothetical protein
LIPLYFLFRLFKDPEEPRQGILRSLFIFSAAFTIGFIPQILIWRLLYGEWFVNLSGVLLPYLRNPFVFETLFSARNGLFVWHPVLIFSFIGLIFLAFRQRGFGTILLVVFLMCVYLNSATVDWWGSVSFGGRRFLNCFVLFAIGFGALAAGFKNLVAAKKISMIGMITAFCIVLILAPLNFYLVKLYRSGNVPRDHAIPFSKHLTGPYSFYLPIITAAQYPVRAFYSARFGIDMSPPASEVFIGEDILYFQQIKGDLIEGEKNPLFGKGWSAPQKDSESMIRKTTSDHSYLNLPMFFKETVPVMMEISLVPENPERVVLDIYLNDEKLMRRPLGIRARPVRLPLPPRKYKKEMNILHIHTSSQDDPGRIPPLVLRNLTFFRAKKRAAPP